MFMKCSKSLKIEILVSWVIDYTPRSSFKLGFVRPIEVHVTATASHIAPCSQTACRMLCTVQNSVDCLEIILKLQANMKYKEPTNRVYR